MASIFKIIQSGKPVPIETYFNFRFNNNTLFDYSIVIDAKLNGVWNYGYLSKSRVSPGETIEKK